MELKYPEGAGGGKGYKDREAVFNLTAKPLREPGVPPIVIDPSYEFCASPRYVYLEVIDRHCYNNHEKKEGCRNEHLFTSNLFSSRISKYVLGRITLDYKNYPTGSILPANLFNGFLISGVRKYHGSVHLRDLYFRVLNEVGDPIWFENENISFCLQVECSHE